MTIISIRSRDLEAANRLDAFQEAVASITDIRLTPEDRDHFSFETTIAALPGLTLGHVRQSASRAVRTPGLAARTDDDVVFHFPLSGKHALRTKGGKASELQAGFVYADPNDVPGEAAFQDGSEGFYVAVPRAHLAGATTGLDDILRKIQPLTPQWRLLVSYARSLHRELPGLPGEDAARCATHVRDLALLALGGGGEAREIAARRGLRAARLAALKRDIAAHLSSPDLSLDMLAGRHGISPSYIRSLFSDEGTAFSDYVRAQRLQKARNMITAPETVHLLISTVAYECGFSDISWFNKAFKRRFGLTPSELRHATLSGAGPDATG